MSKWTKKHDILYLHLALAGADEVINLLERRVLIGVVQRILKDSPPADAPALLAEVSQHMAEPTTTRELIKQYESVLERVAGKLKGRPTARHSLLRSLLKMATADGFYLAVEEVMLLKAAAHRFELVELLHLGEDGRTLRLKRLPEAPSV